MKLPVFSTFGAIFWGGMAAALLDIGAVFAYWATQGVSPLTILKSIASALHGREAYGMGTGAIILGAVLHFAVSFVFAAAYVLIARRVRLLLSWPVPGGLAYGAAAWFIMSHIVVPLSRADFGEPTPFRLALSIAIHLFLFGLPIALAASRLRREA
jgi:hypothetical protein